MCSQLHQLWQCRQSHFIYQPEFQFSIYLRLWDVQSSWQIWANDGQKFWSKRMSPHWNLQIPWNQQSALKIFQERIQKNWSLHHERCVFLSLIKVLRLHRERRKAKSRENLNAWWTLRVESDNGSLLRSSQSDLQWIRRKVTPFQRLSWRSQTEMMKKF